MGFNVHLNRAIILYILQMTTLYNAMVLGWKVKKIGNNRYELSKKIDEINEFDLKNFVNCVGNGKFITQK